ncbi:UNVERIFIED_CONTAM: hypothetical protein FKN15_019905 [Acipenser sinensis]
MFPGHKTHPKHYRFGQILSDALLPPVEVDMAIIVILRAGSDFKCARVLAGACH